MSYYWTVDGVPACRSPKTLVVQPPTVCAHGTRASAQLDIDRTRELFPNSTFEIHEGPCPAYGDRERDHA